MTLETPRKTSLADLASRLAAHVDDTPFLIGVTGSVAVGKSTLCEGLAHALQAQIDVQIVSTDGFLRPNHSLESEGLSLKKGYPSTYDRAALLNALNELRSGQAHIPVYSHVTYDVDPDNRLSVQARGIVLIEGLGLAPVGEDSTITDALDLFVYVDAHEADLEHWFIERFMRLWHAAEQDEASFYRNFRHMTPAEAETFGRAVWNGINLPNLREHILRGRSEADIVISKARDHSLSILRWPG